MAFMISRATFLVPRIVAWLPAAGVPVIYKLCAALVTVLSVLCSTSFSNSNDQPSQILFLATLGLIYLDINQKAMSRSALCVSAFKISIVLLLLFLRVFTGCIAAELPDATGIIAGTSTRPEVPDINEDIVGNILNQRAIEFHTEAAENWDRTNSRLFGLLCPLNPEFANNCSKLSLGRFVMAILEKDAHYSRTNHLQLTHKPTASALVAQAPQPSSDVYNMIQMELDLQAQAEAKGATERELETCPPLSKWTAATF